MLAESHDLLAVSAATIVPEKLERHNQESLPVRRRRCRLKNVTCDDTTERLFL
jgi:hypothetical protein